MTQLWAASSQARWRNALDAYEQTIAAQNVARLPELDRWYSSEFPRAVEARATTHITLPELVRVTEWKMARGVWRAPNLVLVRGNDPGEVLAISRAALAMIPHATKLISGLASLAGVGPATASAVAAAVSPDRYPFFDELVAAQVPDLGPVKWTLSYYARYAEALRERAALVGDGWTPVMVERALWSAVGGKVGLQ